MFGEMITMGFPLILSLEEPLKLPLSGAWHLQPPQAAKNETKEAFCEKMTGWMLYILLLVTFWSSAKI